MNKCLSALLLAAVLFSLSACAPAQSEPALSAGEVAQAALAACGQVSGGTKRLDDQLDEAALTAYLTGYYRLPEGSWDDCAIFQSASSASAFEIAVIRLTGTVDSGTVLAGLEEYLLDRQGDFTGYAPKQASIVENSCAVLSNGGGYAALLICEQADAARAAFFAILNQSAPEPAAQPSATATPAPHAGRLPYVDPEIDDMTLYDTSAILSAWAGGDPSGLSDYDRTIYDRAAQVLEQILADGMSDYEKERAIYQWVVSNVSYDYDHYDNTAALSPDSSTPYNPLVEGKGICLGFSTTFQLLMDMADVECITVVGAAFLSREDHAWNMVRLNGEWYCVDTTWDTGIPASWWNYFNVTSDYMADTDHQWDYGNVPEATAGDGGKG